MLLSFLLSLYMHLSNNIMHDASNYELDPTQNHLLSDTTVLLESHIERSETM